MVLLIEVLVGIRCGAYTSLGIRSKPTSLAEEPFLEGPRRAPRPPSPRGSVDPEQDTVVNRSALSAKW